MTLNEKSPLTLRHINALNRFALVYQYMWRRRLREVFSDNVGFPARTTPRDELLIRELISRLGIELIETFQAVDEGYTQIAWLRKGKEARRNSQRRWHVNSWEIIGANGKSLCAPQRTQSAARDASRQARIFLVEAETSLEDLI